MKYILKTTVLAFICCLFILNTAEAQNDTLIRSVGIKASPYTYLFVSGNDAKNGYNSEKSIVISEIIKNKWKLGFGIGIVSRNFSHSYDFINTIYWDEIMHYKSDVTSTYLSFPLSLTYLQHINKNVTFGYFASVAAAFLVRYSDYAVNNETNFGMNHQRTSRGFGAFKDNSEWFLRIGGDIIFKVNRTCNLTVSPFYNYIIMRKFKRGVHYDYAGGYSRYALSKCIGRHSLGINIGLEYLF